MKDLVKASRSTEPEIGLRGVAALRALAEELEPLHVRRAREQGWSWQKIGRFLMVSKQALHKKYSNEPWA